ncbi:nuclear transcription factor Y subunit gamma isoform X3 [Galleria mellonella]|uniref:Nuclear transcription factor Y subunit gamma n=1 Tax=Galleria mellonella TaxID=7137 RepID=A0ABM3MY78_GALME|nr:nuclear transcription factor Y subunit gamma isoform X3 [Galleria mellonella]
MSVCFFVPADQGGASGVAAEVETEGGEDVVQTDNTQMNLQQFWTKVTDDIKKVTTEDFKMQPLPLARIKKIMKLDEEVKMISAEAPVLFAKAAEIFIHELTLRAWSHTEDNKRRTLQRNDIAMAISKSDQFDFLIDIVPRHEVKPSKPREEPPRPSPATDQSSSAGSSSNNVVSAPQPVTLVQQVLTPSGELQQLPIQLSQAQLNMIRLQIQNNPGQAIIIQGQPQQTPQIIQVSSQAPHQPQQVFLAQVANSQEES